MGMAALLDLNHNSDGLGSIAITECNQVAFFEFSFHVSTYVRGMVVLYHVLRFCQGIILLF